MIRYAVLTISDKGSEGKREDKSGALVLATLKTMPDGVPACYDIIPDDVATIQEKLKYYADQLQVDLVLTTGGTGFSPKDVTPEATRSILHKEAPGIAEAMRMEGLKTTKKAMLSRGVAGIRNKTLIVNLPGSSKGAAESLAVIFSELPHAVWAMTGIDHASVAGTKGD